MTPFDTPLAGKNILVTGATGDIGAAIIRRLASVGARPIIHFSRNERAAASLLEGIGGKGWVIQADLSNPAEPAALWDAAISQAGSVHGLVNNAGIRTEISIEDELDAWQAAWMREFQVDLFSAADLCRSAIRHFRQIGGGRIVNIASRAGQRGYVADAMPYGAAKAALNNLTKSIARNFGKDGVIAIAIAPGWVRTSMAENYVAKHGEAAATADIPTGDLASTEEIAELVAFALLPSQRSINGATLDVNGGSYVR